jgi:uncharacterized Tic20 family protein
MTSKPTRPAPDWRAMPPRQPPAKESGAAVRDADVTWAMLGYLGAIVLGPIVPLVVYLARRRRSQFMRYHAARALNLSLTATLFGVCCLILGGMLALDSITVALVIVLPLMFALWLIMLKYLIRGVIASNRGEPYEVPGWICAPIAK